jgi:hypothetical protein
MPDDNSSGSKMSAYEQRAITAVCIADMFAAQQQDMPLDSHHT